MNFNLENDTYSKDEVTDLIKTYVENETQSLQEQIKKFKPKEKSDKEIELENKFMELAKKEKELNCKQYGIPNDFADFIVDTADFEKIGNFLKQNKSGYIPSNHTSKDTITKEQFQKLSYSEREKLFKQQPDLIKTILK